MPDDETKGDGGSASPGNAEARLCKLSAKDINEAKLAAADLDDMLFDVYSAPAFPPMPDAIDVSPHATFEAVGGLGADRAGGINAGGYDISAKAATADAEEGSIGGACAAALANAAACTKKRVGFHEVSGVN